MRKGIVSILIANIALLASSTLIGFILPNVLSIDEYAYLKTFHLYVAYIGILHLGYSDGVYLKYGGVDFHIINRRELNINISTMRIFQYTVSLCLFLTALFLRDTIFLAFSLSVVPLNMAAYYKFLYQASGEFSKYSRILNANTAITSLSVLGMVFLVKSQKGKEYIFTYVVVSLLIYVALEGMAFRICKPHRILGFSLPELFNNIKAGFVLMLSNFTFGLLSGIDRWFVKLLRPNEDFSFYSFAVSIQIIIDTVTTPVMITLYNYMCKVKDNENIKKIKSICLIVGLYLISSAYVAKFLIERFVPAYLDSIAVLFLLFASQIFYFIIKAIYINCYRARQMQNTYFKQLLVSLSIAVILNIIFYFYLDRKEAFALATLVTTFIWLGICSRKIKELKSKIGEVFVMLSSLTVFLAGGLNFHAWLGLIIYLVYITLLFIVFMRPALSELIKFRN